MSKKNFNAIISLKLESNGKERQVISKVQGEKMDLFAMLTAAMENIEGFADVVVAAGNSYKAYLAEQAKSINQEKKEA